MKRLELNPIDDLRTKYAELLESIAIAKKHVEAMAEPFIGKNEAARFLNMSVTTLERRMSGHDGPPRYIDGGKVTFRRSELLVWRRQWWAGDKAGQEQSVG